MKTELQKWTPFAELNGLHDRLHDLLPGLWNRNGNTSELWKASDWEPAVDIEESDTEFLITADLPDVKKEDIQLTVRDGILTLSGEKKTKSEEKSKTFHRVERFQGSYKRSFALPDNVDEEKLDANYKDGVLKVSLPKLPATEKTPEREVAIN